MIPVKEIKECFEKNAGVAAETGKAIGKAIEFMVMKHPRMTLGLMGGLATGGLALSLADRLHPAHQMFREETKRKAMGEQSDILRRMLAIQESQNKPPVAGQALKTEMLT